MESPFPCSQVLLFDEGKLNTKVPEEDLLPIKEIIKSIREMKIDIVEVLYLIRINIKLQEQNNQKITESNNRVVAGIQITMIVLAILVSSYFLIRNHKKSLKKIIWL